MKSLLRLSVALCAGTLFACGGAAPVAKKAPAPPPEPTIPVAYVDNCKKLRGAFDAELSSGAYVRPQLVVHAWPGKPEKVDGPRTMLPEAHFTAGLRSSAPRVTLMMARGGIGKSTLARAIEAQTCDALLVFRVDLMWDVAENLGAEPAALDPVLAVIARQLGVHEAASPQDAVDNLLRRNRFLLLLDALDEVDMAKRDAVVKLAEAALNPYSQGAAVVFTRPPVFTANYGLAKVDARVEIPLLDCKRTDEALAKLMRDPDKRKNFDAFVGAYGLNRKIEQQGVCYHPHMSTFRDLRVLSRLAETAAGAGGKELTLQVSRAKVHEYFLTAQLLKDLAGLKAVPKDVMVLVDKMVAARGADAGRRSAGYTIGACLAQLPGEDIEARKATCERLMQSTVFAGSARGDSWRFASPLVADLFLARYIDGTLAGADKRTDCGGVGEAAALFESGEVAGFLAGLSNGSQCVLSLATQLCQKGTGAEQTFEQLDQGLPPGAARSGPIATAMAAAGDNAKPGQCIGDVLKRLADTAPPASEAAKGKKKKKRK